MCTMTCQYNWGKWPQHEMHGISGRLPVCNGTGTPVSSLQENLQGEGESLSLEGAWSTSSQS